MLAALALDALLDLIYRRMPPTHNAQDSNDAIRTGSRRSDGGWAPAGTAKGTTGLDMVDQAEGEGVWPRSMVVAPTHAYDVL